MKARIDGFELDGTVDEVSEFMRRYIHHRALPSPDLPAEAPSTDRPTKCDICGEEFAGRATYRAMRIHRSKAHGVIPPEDPPEAFDNQVLSRLYPKPSKVQLYQSQGRTSDQIAVQMKRPQKQVSESLSRLWHRGLAVSLGDGSNEASYWWFRK